MSDTFPVFRAVAIDATDSRAVAEFYRELLGYVYRAGDEMPSPGQPDPQGEDWLVLRDRTGERAHRCPARRRSSGVHLARLTGPATTPPRPHRRRHRRARQAARPGAVPRRERAARSVHRRRRAALRVRRSGRPPLLHLRFARPPELTDAPIRRGQASSLATSRRRRLALRLVLWCAPTRFHVLFLSVVSVDFPCIRQ